MNIAEQFAEHGRLILCGFQRKWPARHKAVRKVHCPHPVPVSSSVRFEEALEPFLQELYRLFDLKMHQEATLYCMGILKGI